MARVTKAGIGGAVKVALVPASGDPVYQTIAEMRSWSVEESADTVEDTNMGSSGVRSYKTTHKTWSGSADVYMAFDLDESATPDDLDEQFTETHDGIALSIGTEYMFKFYVDDGDDTWQSYDGTGIVTGISRSVAHDGMAEMSLTIQGNSALT